MIACDRYENAPAMQVAHRSHVFSMLDGDAIRRVVAEEKPHLIVPEIEAIATDTLVALEKEGHTCIPTALAAKLTMVRASRRRGAGKARVADEGLYRCVVRFVGGGRVGTQGGTLRGGCVCACVLPAREHVGARRGRSELPPCNSCHRLVDHVSHNSRLS